MNHQDKYATKHRQDNPGKHSRSHVNRNGLPKRSMNQEKAEHAARTLRDERGADVHAYQCPQCNQWHVGTLKKK